MKYLLIILFVLPSLAFAQKNKLSIGYSSVAEALTALKNNKSAQLSNNGGWTIVTLKENGLYTIWSFTPENHKAHPAAVKRQIVEEQGSIYIDMTALCQAKKKECDKLMVEFEQLNENIEKAIQKGS